MGITKRFLCTALCAILIPSGALAAENEQRAETVDGFVPASERALYDGVTLRSYDLSDRLLDTTDTGRTVSCYGIQDFGADRPLSRPCPRRSGTRKAEHGKRHSSCFCRLGIGRKDSHRRDKRRYKNRELHTLPRSRHHI